ncbi:MAG: cation-translocating P-type ATPase [Oscillospiraceae bacterium]|nr:cation-translocating P-type ATPase [Oscillospiraceae bacterium]
MQKGLSNREAAALLKKHGENVLAAEKHESAAKIFISQFKDLLTLILLGAAAVSVFMGEFIDAFTIMAIVFINAVIGFSQEYKTERTLENLRAIAAPKATVYRDGKKTEVSASMLVPGDVVVLKSGCRVPADGTVLNSMSLSADESLLTGESLPVEKKIYRGGDTSSLRGDCVYMGTSITSGHGEFTVTATGMDTQMGKIAGLLKESKQEQTPLQQKLAVLSKYIALGCLAICAIVTVTGILRGEPAFDMFLTGLSLSVAAIPEGLTAVITISLGLAVSRMLKKNALIRRLHSVETLGCADIICSDKTGTLTENRMTVTEVFLPDGSIIHPENFAESGQKLCFPLLAAALCNNAEITGAQTVSGEPTEAALMKTVLDCGGPAAIGADDFARTDEIPFNSSRKLMSVSVKSRSGKQYVFAKGAPDVLIPLCKTKLANGVQSPLSSADHSMIKSRLSAMAASALRVLALGYKEYSGGKITEDGFTFLGLFGMIDPPRKGAADSVLKCRKAGIRTVMITGDHPETAFAIAKSLKIAARKEEIITGKELDRLSEKEFASAVEHRNVFARVTPAHKLKIVRALKKNGHIVAMTGDGVNDAPAVKEADIGVSMGKNGTDVTREASGIVLLDDDFSTLVAAAEEGRIIYQNIRKFIRYLLSCNIGEVVTMFFGMLMGMPVVLLPIQILMVNLVTDGIPAIALSFDPPQDDVMAEMPRKRSESVFSNGLAMTIITRGFLIGLSVLGAFTTVLGLCGDIDSARTAAFLALVFTQLVHVFECKSETRSLFTINLLSNMKLVWAVISSAAIVLSTVYIPALNVIFKTVPLDLVSVLTVLGFTLAVPVISGVLHIFRKKQ